MLPRTGILLLTLFIACGKGYKRSSSLLPLPLDCHGTIDQTGFFVFSQQAVPVGQVCLSMIKAPKDKKIEIRIKPINVPCSGPPELAFIDGLNLNNDFFPSVSDSPGGAEGRERVLCSTIPSTQRLVASQNVASILHRFSQVGSGFTLHVRFLPNPTPCNVIEPHPNATGIVTLSNYGHRRNCSLLILYPTEFSVVDSRIGKESYCHKARDYFEIRSGLSVDPLRNTRRTDSCALAVSRRLGYKGHLTASAPCYASVVRLVSSGAFNNVVVIKHRPMDLVAANRDCPME